MHPLLTVPALASVEEYIPLFGILVPITLFLVGLLIVTAVLYFRNQQRKLWHETARIALEKGQPIPAIPTALEADAMFKPAPKAHNNGHGDVRAGLILLAISAGLYFGREGIHIPMAGVYIPGFIGLAILLNALISYLITKKNLPEKPLPLPTPKA